MTVDGQASEWAVFNAVSEYWQHRSTSRPRQGTDPKEERFRNNMMGGTQERMRSVAFDTLMHREELELAATTAN